MDIQQNQTTQGLPILLISSSDHITGLTGKAGSMVVKIGKNGGAGTTPLGAITEDDATNLPGCYTLAPNATDANTLGPLKLYAKDAASDPANETFNVVVYNPLSSTIGEPSTMSLAWPPTFTNDSKLQNFSIKPHVGVAGGLIDFSGTSATDFTYSISAPNGQLFNPDQVFVSLVSDIDGTNYSQPPVHGSENFKAVSPEPLSLNVYRMNFVEYSQFASGVRLYFLYVPNDPNSPSQLTISAQYKQAP